MKKNFLTYCATFVALTVTGIFINTDPALAQQSGEMSEVVVVGAPIERSRESGGAMGGTNMEVIELKRRVTYADLDLSKYADVTQMETRIEMSAKESCQKLADMFRLDNPAGRSDEIASCTKLAIKNANQQLLVAVAAAE